MTQERHQMTSHQESVPRPILIGEGIILRPPRLADKQDRLGCGQNAELVRMYGGDYTHISPLTEEGVDRWYERLQGDRLAWAIESEGRCVGHCRLNSLDEGNRSARYAIGIFNPAFWGKGIGSA